MWGEKTLNNNHMVDYNFRFIYTIVHDIMEDFIEHIKDDFSFSKLSKMMIEWFQEIKNKKGIYDFEIVEEDSSLKIGWKLYESEEVFSGFCLTMNKDVELKKEIDANI